MGCEALGGTDWGHVDPRLAREAVRCALDLGITVFDTADVYGLGRGEEELCLALGEDRHRVTIVTKGGLRWTIPTGGKRASTHPDASAKHLTHAIESSLRRLRIDAIPLYLIHWPDPETPLPETLAALERARSKGQIVNYGLSNFDFPSVQAASRLGGVCAIEGPLSLVSPETLLRDYSAARELDLMVLAYGPLAQGLLTGKYSVGSSFDPNDRRHRLEHFAPDAYRTYEPVLATLENVAKDISRSAAQVAIRWVMDTGVASNVIVGAKSPAQVLDNHAGVSCALNATHLAKLNDARRRAGLARD